MKWTVKKLKKYPGAKKLTDAQLKDVVRILNKAPEAAQRLPEPWITVI